MYFFSHFSKISKLKKRWAPSRLCAEKCTGKFSSFSVFKLLVVGCSTFQHALTIPMPQYNLGVEKLQFETVQAALLRSLQYLVVHTPVVLTDTHKVHRGLHPFGIKICHFMCFFPSRTHLDPPTYMPDCNQSCSVTSCTWHN
jgi:hypothetical protein